MAEWLCVYEREWWLYMGNEQRAARPFTVQSRAAVAELKQVRASSDVDGIWKPVRAPPRLA